MTCFDQYGCCPGCKRGFNITEFITNHGHIGQVNVQTFTDLIKQAGFWFPAIATCFRIMGTEEKCIDCSTILRQVIE